MAIPKECKRLAEVDFPIATVSRHSAREKSIRHGHPSTLHLWWARRPLAACRAVLLGLLLPDPCDEHCPKEFKTKARELLRKVPGKLGASDKELRDALLKFIGDFADWDHAAHSTFLEVGRGLVKAAHPEETPLVVDPFAGGGSIPLEALRLGCETFASDLNPVACLILKVMLEDIPRHGPQLADELRRVGSEVKQAAERELAQYYPADKDGSRPIAYLWARTVRCEAVGCGAEIPLVRSFWLCKKANRKRALRYKVVGRDGPPGRPKPSHEAARPAVVPYLEWEIYEPKSDEDVPPGTVTRANATCPCCRMVLPAARVRAQLAAQRGGADVIFKDEGQRLKAKGNDTESADSLQPSSFSLPPCRLGGARLLAVVTLKDGEPGRHYRLASDRDYEAVWKAQQAVAKLPNGAVPDETVNPIRPSPNARGLSAVTRYGVQVFGDLFTARQKLMLVSFVRNISAASSLSAVEAMSLALSRLANASTSFCRWHQSGEKLEGVYARQAIPLIWDFCEGVPLSDATGGFSGAIDWVSRVAEVCGRSATAQVQCANACLSPLPDDATDVWFTDPPYYDAIPYADLSDFFFVWLKRVLVRDRLLNARLDPTTGLTPKMEECVWNQSYTVDGRPKDGAFFEKTVALAFAQGRRVLKDDGVGCVVFAHKTTEGWEALLSGMIRGGWVVTGSWPVATEMGNRVNAREAASLATSIHLVCRPRTEDETGDWSTVLRELPTRVGDWMERLQGEGVRGADLVFACIGPALEIFSRYAKVETAEGKEVPLATYLEKVWEVVGRTALEQVLGTAEAKARNGAAGALEEDARLTALFLWTLQATDVAKDEGGGMKDENGEETEDGDEEESAKAKPKGFSLIYDVARRFAQPLGIHLDAWEGRIIETDKGVVRLLPVSERAKQLFGEEGAQAMAARLERERKIDPQMLLFSQQQGADVPEVRGRKRGRSRHQTAAGETPAPQQATTLDRVHAAMLLQSSGQSNALRAMLKAEQERGPDFLRLANALSALYPKDCEEKRLLDAMLLAVPR